MTSKPSSSLVKITAWHILCIIMLFINYVSHLSFSPTTSRPRPPQIALLKKNLLRGRPTLRRAASQSKRLLRKGTSQHQVSSIDDKQVRQDRSFLGGGRGIRRLEEKEPT